MESHQLTFSAVERAQFEFLLHLPPGYEKSKRKRWPFILFLHGAGERGGDVKAAGKHGLPRWIAENPDFPFIVAAPLCAEHEWWRSASLIPFVNELLERYRIDAGRVYATGISMGGYGTWELGLVCPEKFAAIVPVCGGGNLLPVLLAEDFKDPALRALRSLGVWAFHGAKDDVVALSESQRMVDALREAGCREVNFTIYPEADHDSWTPTYSNPALYKWFLKHSRKSR
jgi:predicted peptidase